MASINAWRWEKFTPNLGDNREQEKPFFFRVKCGISKVELDAFSRAIAAMSEAKDDALSPEVLAAPFAGLVELGDEPLVVNNQTVTTLDGYMALFLGLATSEPWLELTSAVTHFNSYSGTRALFFERLSGGEAFTAKPRAAKASARTVGP